VKAGGSRELPGAIFSIGVSVRAANRATKSRIILGSGLLLPASAKQATEQMSLGQEQTR
jgi:hypothetical protein